MSRKLPALTGSDMIRALEKAGFSVDRIRGSHHFMGHPDGRTTVVPAHAGEDLGIGLVGKILRDCELSKDQLRALL